MANKSLKEAAILGVALYAWCTVGGKVGGYCIGKIITLTKPFHPIPSYDNKISMEDQRKSAVENEPTMNRPGNNDGESVND